MYHCFIKYIAAAGYLFYFTSIFILPICRANDTGRPENPEPSKAPEQISITQVTTKQLYSLDEQIRNKQKEALNLRNEAIRKLQDNFFQEANNLKEKADKMENEIKQLKIDLDKLVLKRSDFWQAKSWWERTAFQVGTSYIFFDNDLHLDNETLFKIKVHWLNEKFRPFHAGYLYYPLESKNNAPLRRILASSFIIEYRQSQTKIETLINNQKETVDFNAYLIGFGLSGQTWKNTYLSLNIGGGRQRFNGTDPNDTGPILSYTIGLEQKVRNQIGLGVELTEDVIWSKANRENTLTLFNFSAGAFLTFNF